MSAIAISAVAFVSIFSATLLCMLLGSLLPDRYRSAGSKEVVTQWTTLIATMSAVLLGLLISSTRTVYEEKRNQVIRMTADLIELDLILKDYGPEARPVRQVMRDAVPSMIGSIWRDNASRFRADANAVPDAGAEAVLDRLVELSPHDDDHRARRERALQVGLNLAQIQLLLFSQPANAISTPFITVLVLWLTFIFATVSIYARANPLIVVVLFVCALSASSAIFLILDLDRPFAGLLQIPQRAPSQRTATACRNDLKREGIPARAVVLPRAARTGAARCTPDADDAIYASKRPRVSEIGFPSRWVDEMVALLMLLIMREREQALRVPYRAPLLTRFAGATLTLVALLASVDAVPGQVAGAPMPGCPDLVWGSLPTEGPPEYPDREALCASIPGEPLPPDLWPPEDLVSLDEQNGYAQRLLSEFLRPRRFATELGWVGDAHWRLSGDFQGCPSQSSFATFGVHLLVRVWYSPEVVEWLCGDRSTVLPDGATIVKEEHLFQGDGTITIDPKTHRAAPAQDLTTDIFSIMIKRASAAWDGYYWGAMNANGTPANPPVMDRAGLTAPAPAHLPPHEPPYFPTGAFNGSPEGAAVYANFGYGMYCVNCHSVAKGEPTFSALDNILGTEKIFSWRGRGSVPRCGGDRVEGPPIDPGAGLAVVGKGCPPALPPAPLNAPDPSFLALYDEVAPITDDEVWNGLDLATGGSAPKIGPLRYPAAQSWDRSVMPAPEQPRTFVTSDQCVGCHDGIRNNGVLPYMVAFDRHGHLRNLSPDSEWRNSSMGLAGRDPIFMARMEAEWNAQARNFAKVSGLGNTAAPTVADCVMDLCLSCHAKAGHQQQSIDTRGMGTDPLPGSVLQVQNTYICRDLLPEPLARNLKTKEDGHDFFVRPDLQNWPGTPDVTRDQLRAASLGRDGVTCLVCHLAGPDVGKSADGYTGNIPYTLDGKLFSPDEIGHPGDIMDAAIGLKPEQGKQLQESRLCGACHAINLPVVRSGDCTTNPETSPFAGCVASFKYEQTTYLEYLNSAYYADSGSVEPGLVRECQDCHMQNLHATSGQEHLAFKVANIQDDSFYRYDNSLPPEYLALPVRRDYQRHVFPGLNLFLNAFQQQFPLLLGHADLDWMNVTPEMGVLTQRDVLLEFARAKTARITVRNLQSTGEGLRAAVRVDNLTGHNLPSGVGFRRLFIEFSVLDRKGNVLWSSGRTDKLGQLLRADGTPLPSEHYPATVYEPHHQVIRSPDEVQIYEEVVTDDLGVVTTGFLNRFHDKKDNRIPPRGFRWDSMYAHEPYDAAPKGEALADPQYAPADPKTPLDGMDEITYDITLPSDVRKQATAVRARLISQSVPPYFLSQIFAELAIAKADPELVASDNQLIVDGSFLHYLASRLDTSAVNADGEAYLEEWKLEVAADQQPLHAASDSDSCAVAAPADRATGWLLLLPAAAWLLLRRQKRDS